MPAYLSSGPLPATSGPLNDLDPSQQEALQHALRNRLAIIQVLSIYEYRYINQNLFGILKFLTSRIVQYGTFDAVVLLK